MLDYVILIILGLLVGILSPFFGIGGGVLIIPGLYFLYPDAAPPLIIGCSLGVIFLNSTRNVFLMRKSSMAINLSLMSVMVVGTLSGVFIGAPLTLHLDPLIIRKIFTLILIAVALKIFFEKKSKKDDESELKVTPSKYALGFITGLSGGLIAIITGLGGGVVMVPLLISLVKIPIRHVSFYSTCLMVFISSVGLYKFIFSTSDGTVGGLDKYTYGNINILIILVIWVGTYISGPLGVKLGEKVSDPRRRLLFIILLVLMAIRMIASF